MKRPLNIATLKTALKMKDLTTGVWYLMEMFTVQMGTCTQVGKGVFKPLGMTRFQVIGPELTMGTSTLGGKGSVGLTTPGIRHQGQTSLPGVWNQHQNHKFEGKCLANIFEN